MKKTVNMKRLNIFIDETGTFEDNTSLLFGVSFVLHEQRNSISNDIEILNNRLKKIDYYGMIHMSNLISKREEYKDYSLEKRRKIFYSLYQFSRKIDVKYKTIIVDKKYTDSKKILKNVLIRTINDFINNNIDFFNKFDSIIIYYDDGQDNLSIILDIVFSQLKGYKKENIFNKASKKLFQVADMLTYIDKYDYKYKNKMKFSKSEKFFFTDEEMRKILKELNKKRL